MFDWARGSVLKQMIAAGIPGAAYDDWLHGWATAWPQYVIECAPEASVLDVAMGDGRRHHAEKFAREGCRVESISGADITAIAASTSWKTDAFDSITWKIGAFDLITAISLDHLESLEPLNIRQPLAQQELLRRCVNALKPDGVLIWSAPVVLDVSDTPPLLDYAANIHWLQLSGLSLLSASSQVHERPYLYNAADTIFMQPGAIFSLADSYFRATRIGAALRKPAESDADKLVVRLVSSRLQPQTDWAPKDYWAQGVF